MPAGDSPPATGSSAGTGSPTLRKRKAASGAGATSAVRDDQVPRARGSTGNGANAKGKKAKTPPSIFTWKSQKMGLPTDVRTDLRDLLKTGKTAKASTKNFQLPSYQGNDHYQPLFCSETTSYGYYLFN